ncbi:MAG: hypothetical protein A2152_03960 [Candidatus Levybacteria bacterium RBG_16_35_6]|nr:MAG: hypothetical protein A2152_03960 [Candidatus Levybacteria bacterium RBG_16_35_6]
MRIGGVGAGFTGLAAAYSLAKSGHKVFVFEKGDLPGGLASGYKKANWDWALDKHYHHFFTNDSFTLNLAKEVDQKVLILRPKTSTLIKGSIYQLDSPKSLLEFPLLTPFERFKMGITLAFLRFSPFYKGFDKYKAMEFLPKMMGKKGFEMIWKPLFLAKFGKYSKSVSLAWFWARIKKRTTSLAYPEGGFLIFAEKIKDACEKKGATFNFNSEVIEIEKDYLKIKTNSKIRKEKFDRIIFTASSPIFLKSVKSLPEKYKENLTNLKSLAATNLLLRFKKPFLAEDTYWLNVCEPESKLMAVVEHTNFIDKKFYNNESLVYVGHYVSYNHPYLKMTKEELLREFHPYLLLLNKNYQKNLIGTELSKDLFAQPVITTNYLKKIPPFETPISNVFLANMDHVYPWDRGVNYAIELGVKIANEVVKNT